MKMAVPSSPQRKCELKRTDFAPMGPEALEVYEDEESPRTQGCGFSDAGLTASLQGFFTKLKSVSVGDTD